ncbi:hypothetical protein [Cyclobacterium xiamenense]|jgi:hypothetical protein|uniref:hypothetical protein n=1 Tax=Cyclobacterium xiamenense TaxID=1297121 RepID=UPI0012B7AD3B|nr:hypothetical protein [Cyclobacterium xiamenense]
MTISAKNLLLLDGVGALMTATLLTQVVARYEPLFGMPKATVYVLSVVALGFAAFSLGSYLLAKRGFSRYLGMILFANLAYCVATATLLFVYREKITWLGIAYFVGEIILVLVLVYQEYKKVTPGIGGKPFV